MADRRVDLVGAVPHVQVVHEDGSLTSVSSVMSPTLLSSASPSVPRGWRPSAATLPTSTGTIRLRSAHGGPRRRPRPPPCPRSRSPAASRGVREPDVADVRGRVAAILGGHRGGRPRVARAGAASCGAASSRVALWAAVAGGLGVTESTFARRACVWWVRRREASPLPEWPTSAAAPAARRPCRHFQRGTCLYGAKCGFLHDGRQAAPTRLRRRPRRRRRRRRSTRCSPSFRSSRSR